MGKRLVHLKAIFSVVGFANSARLECSLLSSLIRGSLV